MPLTKEKKEELVAEYTELLQNSRALLVTDYRGLNTSMITELRRKVADANATFMVIKNRLFRLAMQNVGLDIPEDFLDGPVAAGFVYGDVPPVAKALTEFAKDSEILIVRGGLMDEGFLTPAEVQALADLPPLDVIRAQLLGLMDAPAANIAGVMASSVRQVVNVLAVFGDRADAPPDGNADAPVADAEADANAEAPVEAEAQADAEVEAEAQAEDAEVETEADAEPEADEEADDNASEEE